MKIKQVTLKKMEKFFDSGKVKLFLGITLFVSASIEALEIGLCEMLGFHFHSHYGLMIFAFAKIGEAVSKIGIELVEVGDGADEIKESVDK